MPPVIKRLTTIVHSIPSVFFGFFAVILNRLLERLEGIHGLLEYLDDRNTAHVFGACLAHGILRRLILLHELCVFAAHHGEHGEYGNDCRQNTRRAHAPVKHKHQHQHRDKHRDRADNIGKIMSEKRFGLRRSAIQTVAQKSRCVAVKKAERRFHQMRHAALADIGCGAERCQVRTHQRGEINDNTAHGKAKRQPAVFGDFRRLRPVGRYRD